METQEEQVNNEPIKEPETSIPTAVTEPQPTKTGKNMSIASMVLGICATALLCLPAGIVGLVLAAISLKRKYEGRNMAIAGLVTSIVSIALSILVACIIIFAVIAAVGLSHYSYNYWLN